MTVDEAALEAELQALGLNAPRVTPAQVDAEILSERYHCFAGTTVTVCLLVLRNGFSVIGESAAASPENFDTEIGRKIAREDARRKIWPLLGFLLRQRLHEAAEAAASPLADQVKVTYDGPLADAPGGA
ncbi:MAG TPA: Gp49 family protein [Rhodocyclaceae bacterium]|nr:Gp49 family protein [Rhodocyclaceae bacterium]